MKHSIHSPSFFLFFNIWTASVVPHLFIFAQVQWLIFLISPPAPSIILLMLFPTKQMFGILAFLIFFVLVFLALSWLPFFLHLLFCLLGGTRRVDVFGLWGVNEGGWDLRHHQPNSAPSADGHSLWVALRSVYLCKHIFSQRKTYLFVSKDKCVRFTGDSESAIFVDVTSCRCLF